MAEGFNPYHVWFGIPPEEQPANHYRLLSIRLFEASGDVIDSAADRQMAHLRTFQSGKHGELTQRLLNEVAAARVCLLDPKKRAAYDQQLRAKLAATAAAAPATGAAPQAADGSGIQRQPLRRMPVAMPMQPQAAPLSQAAATPKPADVWVDLLGDSGGKPATKAGGKSGKAAAAKRNAANRTLAYGIAGLVVVAAAIGIGILASGGGSAAANGTLVFDLPAADRSDTTVTVDGKPITIPADGRWDGPPGEHHVAGQRPAYKFAADVTVVAGQEQKLSPEWQPKAVLVLNLPPELRSGAELKIDGHTHPITRQTTVEIAVDPGQHLIQIIRPGSETIGTTASVEANGRELVAIKPPPTTATLVFDWPADERKDAELTVDGHRQTVSAGDGANPFELTVPPGKHVVRIARSGFESFRQSVELSAGANESIKPAWKPEQQATPVVETPADTAPQPVKKLAPPAAAEQEKIAKQLDDLYKTTGPGAKDPAKAQALYDVAAKDAAAPAERYVLLMKGAEIAAAGADLNLSLSGIDMLDADYDIDALELKQKLLDKFIAAGKPEQVAIAIQIAEQLVDQAVAADRYDIAVVLATSASKAVAKSKIPKHKEVEESLARRRHDIRLLEPIYAAAKKAQETLKATPADPEANLTVGRWLCFYKGDWTTGLPMLAKGSDEKLKTLAEQEIKAPTDADEQVKIADAWWDLAQKEAGTARDSLHLHAGEIYQAATPNLTSALKKAAVGKRLTEIANVKPIVAAVATANSIGVAKFPLGQWADVLPFIDPSRDRVEGNWVRSGEGLSIDTGDHYCRIAIPVDIDGSYDLAVDFTRTSDRNDVATMVSIGSHATMVMLSGNGGAVSGLMRVNDRDPFDSRNPISTRPGSLENGHRYRLFIKARTLSNGRASIDVALDGKPYLPHWEGEPSELSYHPAWALPNPKRLGIGAYRGAVTFHSARLRMVSGRASLDPAVAETLAPQVAPSTVTSDKPSGAVKIPLNQWVDVLRLVDTTKNVVAGRWSRAEDKIKVESDNQSRIVIPVAVAGSYDLEVELNRHDGSGDLHTTLPVGARSCDISLGQDGHIGGLETVDNLRAFDEKNPITARSPPFENDHTYHLLAKVRVSSADRASIDVSLDGKPYLPHWEGDPATLGVSEDWAMPTVDHLGLGAWRSQVTYSSVKLRMISGRATDDSAIAGPPGAGSPTNSNPPTIVKARWGRRKTWVDVTEVVKEAVAKGEVVYANSGFLKVDPTEGRKKQLQITYKLGDTERAANINEGDKWSQP